MFDRNSFSDVFFANLREIVRSYVDDRRYAHILAVEKKACELARAHMPEKSDVIRAAAILHDITKCMSVDENRAICSKYGYDLPSDYPPKLLHAVSAPLMIAGELAPEYPCLGDPEILGAIRWHTTGRAGMTVPEAIVYLADYIEDTRTYEMCAAVRDYYENGLCGDQTQKNLHFYKTMAICLGYTINHLKDNNAAIDANTVEARDYYLDLIEESEKRTN